MARKLTEEQEEIKKLDKKKGFKVGITDRDTSKPKDPKFDLEEEPVAPSVSAPSETPAPDQEKAGLKGNFLSGLGAFIPMLAGLAIAGPEGGAAAGKGFLDTSMALEELRLKQQGDPLAQERIKIAQGNLGLREKELELKEEGEKRRQRGLVFKENETVKKRKEKILESFNKDPSIVDARKALVASSKAREIVNKGGKLAPAVMGRLLARMAGEVGVMTDKDVEAFRGSPQWTDAMERFFQRGVKGTLTDTDKKEMENMINRMEAVEKTVVTSLGDIRAEQYSEASGLSEEEIRRVLRAERVSNFAEMPAEEKKKQKFPVGTQLKSGGKIFRVMDEEGNLEEVK